MYGHGGVVASGFRVNTDYNYAGGGKSEMCPSSNVLWDNNGVPEDVLECGIKKLHGGWLPHVFRDPAFWAYLCFYLAFKIGLYRYGTRLLMHLRATLYHTELYTSSSSSLRAPQHLTPLRVNVLPATSSSSSSSSSSSLLVEATFVSPQMAAIVNGYTPSFFHALTAVVLAAIALFGTFSHATAKEAYLLGLDPDSWPRITYYDVLLHSNGYLLADCIVDRDPTYFTHHIGVLLFSEFLLRHRGSFYHSVWFGLVCELGNVYMHGNALSMMVTTGATFSNRIRRALVVSRLLSLLPAALIVECDIPVDHRFLCACTVLMCLVGILGSNLASLFIASSTVAIDVGHSPPSSSSSSSSSLSSSVSPHPHKVQYVQSTSLF